MGFLIGGPDTTIFGGLSTWGKLRTAVGQITPSGNYQLPTLKQDFNREWDETYYFTSLETGSFVKSGFSLSPGDQPSTANMLQPNIIISDAGGSDILVTFSNSFDVDTMLTQLTGQAVGGYGGTFSITTPMNTTNVVVTGGGPLTSEIASVGRLGQTT